MEKIINGFSMYTIHSSGKVYNTKKQELKSCLSNSGYLYVTLYNNGAKCKYYIHRLVAEHFLQCTIKRTVNHIDGNKQNNNIGNLEWCSTSQNTKHAYDNNLIVKSRISDNIEPKYLYDKYKNGLTMLEIAYLLDIGITSVSKYINMYVKNNNLEDEFTSLKSYYRSLSNKKRNT